MGERYVWGKYDVQTTYTQIHSDSSSVENDMISFSTFYLAASITFNSENGTYTLTNPSGPYSTSKTTLSSISVSESTKYIAQKASGNTIVYEVGNASAQRWWYGNGVVYLGGGGPSGTMNLGSNTVSTNISAGSKISDISSQADSAYPLNAQYGSYWYIYQGSDNIDPSAVSLPSFAQPNQQNTITVTPGTGKVYDGTVSYEYQVKLDSGEWQTVATTTATTQTYTVPAGTQTIQARVVASDDLGFTSTTYVESAAVNVIGTPASITVPGAAMIGQSLQVSWSAVETGGES